MSEGNANNDVEDNINVELSKDLKGVVLVELCMTYRYFKNDDLNSKYPTNEMMATFICPNCKDHPKPFILTQPKQRGCTNPSNHFIKCLGSKANLIEFVKTRKKTLAQQLLDEGRSPIRKQEKIVLDNSFMATDRVLSLNMWIKKLVLKNMPILRYRVPHRKGMRQVSSSEVIKGCYRYLPLPCTDCRGKNICHDEEIAGRVANL